MSNTTDLDTGREVLPLLPLRGLVVFPHMVLHFDVGREKSVVALEEAMVNGQLIFLTAQKDARESKPASSDIFDVGTVSRIKQILKLPGDSIRVLVEGLYRARIVEYLQKDPFLEVLISRDDEAALPSSLETEALMRSVLDAFENFAKLSSRVSPETLLSVSAVSDPAQLADIVAANILVNLEDKQRVLECFMVDERLQELLNILGREIEILEIENKISYRVRKQIDKNQKEYYLREQLKAIKTELGDKEGGLSEIEELQQRIEETPLNEEARERALRELDRLSKMPQGSPETTVSRTYIDWILDLPWGKETQDNMDPEHAQGILDQDHYGLKKVKERVVEYLAVRKLTQNMKGPILCFVGPPGVGKTSIARSIARAVGREFVRMSLGGVRDEAEIRGHRRTYIGAIPGRIITHLKQAGSMNPVFLFDEIDKMSSDFRGDPASAMLEVLDSEQNFAFRDHYMELPVDLSRVMFLTTANTRDTIPQPLLDRMEVIEITSYTEEEKLRIAMDFLLPKMLREHGLKSENMHISEHVMRDIINQYTRESGVRSLERTIGAVCRKTARIVAGGKKQTVQVTSKALGRMLGAPRYRDNLAEKEDQTGMVTGLAWTKVGGLTLAVEVTLMPGSGALELTGQMGDVMKESARAGLSYIRSRAKQLGIKEDFHKNKDIHIHIPEGAIPKDGPSAGITMATAIISALTGKRVRKDVAMTGEITLRGRVLPVGGLTEKILAAHRAGITNVILPADNQRDVDEIPRNVRRKMHFIFAGDLDTVLQNALVQT